MAVDILNQTQFNGGISPAEKIGPAGSFRFGQGLDIHSDPNKITLLPTPTKVSGSTVVDLVKWIAPGTPHNSSKYFYGSAGSIYRETLAGSWSLLKTVSNSAGQGLEVSANYLIYTQNSQVGRYGPLDGVPTFVDDWKTGLNNTSGVGFSPVKNFLTGFVVGHGNKVGYWDGSVWTVNKLTLPEGLNIVSIDVIDEFAYFGTRRGNTVLDSEEGYVFAWDGVTANPSFFFANPEGGCNGLLNSRNRLLSVWGSSGYIYLINDALNKKTFDKVHQLPRLALGKYAEIYPGAMSNWRGLSILGFHANTDSEVVEPGIYAWGSKSALYPEAFNFMFSPSVGSSTGPTYTVDQSQLTNTANHEHTWGQVPGTGNNRSQVGQFFQAGSNQSFARCSFWLGRVENPTDSVQAELYNATLVGSTLTIGSLIDTSTDSVLGSSLPEIVLGGEGTEQKFNFNLNSLTSGQYYLIAVKRTGAADSSNHYAAGGTATDSYAAGSQIVRTASTGNWATGAPTHADRTFRTYYYASEGSTASNRKIGAVKGIGSNLYFSWANDSTYGVDKVSNSGATSSCYIETLINDDGQPGNDKLAMVIKATHSALLSGQGVQLGYKKNRATVFTSGTANSTVGSTETRLVIPPQDARYREIESKCTVTATTAFELYSIGLQRNDLSEEKDY